MIDLDRIRRATLETEPYRWAAIDRVFTTGDCARLARSYPLDHYKLVTGYGGEKEYECEEKWRYATSAVLRRRNWSR